MVMSCCEVMKSRCGDEVMHSKHKYKLKTLIKLPDWRKTTNNC